MATFGETICLGEIYSEVRLSGVEESDCEDSVLASVDSKSNRIIKVKDQKIIQSWSLKQGDRITSPAIFNKSLAEFISVINHESLRLWNKDCVNFEKAKKKKTAHPVYRIINREKDEPLVLFTNGLVSTLSNCNQSTESGYINSSDVIVSSALCRTKNNEFIVYITTDPNKKVTVHKCVYCHREERWKYMSHRVDKDAELTCCCSSSINGVCYLHLLWSNGELDRACVAVETDFIALSNIYNLPTPLWENSSLVLLDPTHIAISGIKKDGKNGIGILETKFQAVQAFQEFPDDSPNQSPIFCSNKYIFCTCRKHLYAFPYSCINSSVADLIGHMTNDDINTSKSVFTNHLQWNVHTQTVVADENYNKVHEMFEEICDPVKCSSYASFKKTFSKLLEEIIKPENKNWIASFHMSKLINRCTKEEKFWPHTEIIELITNKFIPSSCISNVFEALVKHKQYSTLHKAFQCLNNIPESSIVKCLQFYLSASDKEFSELPESPTKTPLIEENEELKSPYSHQKAPYINQLLSIPFSDVFLLECLRDLEFKTVLGLLEHLHFLLNSGLDDSGTNISHHNELTQIQVLEWTCLLLDAHVTQLIISPDSHRLLINLHETVQAKLQFCEELVSLEAVLSQLKEKCAISPQQKVGQYCIEVLHVL